jgi:hypothetical protein
MSKIRDEQVERLQMGFGNPLFDGDRREGPDVLEPARVTPAPYKQKLEFLSLWAGNAAAPRAEPAEASAEDRRDEG